LPCSCAGSHLHITGLGRDRLSPAAGDQVSLASCYDEAVMEDVRAEQLVAVTLQILDEPGHPILEQRDAKQCAERAG